MLTLYIRLYCYHYLLDRPDIVLPLLTCGQAWHRKLVFRLIFPKVRDVMRRFMRIDARTAGIALKKLTHASDRLHAQLGQTPFLAGTDFSRADLAAAALLAPFTMPDKYGLEWPASIPDELAASIDSLRPKLEWVDALYRDNR